jgi:effector-binding domain-containing protein
MEATQVERDEIAVLFIRTPDDVEAFGPAFQRLEQLVGLRGRKYYGAFYPREKEYRACVEAREGDDAQALGLESGTLPGGRYLRSRLRGEPPELYSRIGPLFEALAAENPSDDSRPSIEFYRRLDEIDLLLPVPNE